MFDLEKIKREFTDCDCGSKHELNIKDVVIGSGAVNRVGEILSTNGFGKRILLVADKNTLKAAAGCCISYNKR